jgi:allantoin racemase
VKVQYLVPGPMSRGPMGARELRRREALLASWAFAGTTVEVVDVPTGPSSIESVYEEMLAIPETLAGVQRAERDGFDAVIIGCFGDPALDGAREIVSIPVIGPGQSSMLLAAELGHRFSVITVMDSILAPMEHQAQKAGVGHKLASVLSADIPVLELMNDRDATLARMIDVGRQATSRDRADAIALGCMTMSFLNVADELSAALGVPVINAGKAALKAAESLVSQGLSHSKRAYPVPPKLRSTPQEVVA